MTPDQYRREGFQAGIEAAALAAEDRTPSKHGGALAAHVTGMAIQKAIRAIDVDEVLAGMPTAPDALAQLVRHADRFLPVFLATSARNVDFDGPWDDFDLSGGLRAVIAAMETDHDG